MNKWCIFWLFKHIFTARRVYKSFDVKGLMHMDVLIYPGYAAESSVGRQHAARRMCLVRHVAGVTRLTPFSPKQQLKFTFLFDFVNGRAQWSFG
jgi:hypothetical protein